MSDFDRILVERIVALERKFNDSERREYSKSPSVYKEILIPVTRLQSSGVSAPTLTVRAAGASGGIKVPILSFSKTSEQEVYTEMHMPTDVDGSVNVSFHLMWVPGASWTSGNYMWKLEYLVKNEFGVAINAGSPTTIEESVTPANAVDLIETEFSDTIDAGPDQVIMARFYRDVANDNGNDVGDVRFIEIEYVSSSDGEPL